MKTLATYLPPLAVALLLVGAARPAPAQRRAPRDRGGTSLLLEVKAEGAQAARAVERTAEVIRKRCARLGVRCALTPRPGAVANRLALRFSAAQGTERVKNVLLAEGLELRAVVSPRHPAPVSVYMLPADAEANAEDGTDVLPLVEAGSPLSYVVTERAPIINGDALRDPFVVRAGRDEPGGGYVVNGLLSRAGSARLGAWTSANVGRYVAVVFNGRVRNTVYVKAPITANVVLSGGFDLRQAEDAAAVIAGGNLPAPVEVLEEGAYKP